MGEEKSLTEILQDLINYCYAKTGKHSILKLELPKTVLDNFNIQYYPKERIVLFGDEPEPKGSVRNMVLLGGQVELVAKDES